MVSNTLNIKKIKITGIIFSQKILGEIFVFVGETLRALCSIYKKKSAAPKRARHRKNG